MALEKLNLEHIPPTCQIYAAFFRDVSNCEFLHTQLLSRNSEFEYAFIDASSVISRLHLLAAVYSAANMLLDGTLRTPNVHSEIVVSLNTNNNIADAYRRWGITPGKTKDLIVVKVVLSSSTAQVEASTQAQTQEAIWDHIQQHVKGTPTPLTDAELAQTTEWPKVRKYYRLNGVPSLERLADEQEQRQQSESLAIMGMALRGL
ncbi:kinase binding protein CGI-121-domain-containing protein [Chaetomium fimeti]|jgi:EKC/KEOPS complex subunit CGI121/TPRKB|uniref:EKC/KEOPS complex subunit CGI121 n=1 Tax=Chaetomium fimeti TaxID=1854472 RepID=A0AAE0LWY5_9PEZI|nr:kinase binding protein CGI-121-domain-containing protein [Chaetomium fimeti]